jgi:hypothetical protein
LLVRPGRKTGRASFALPIPLVMPVMRDGAKRASHEARKPKPRPDRCQEGAGERPHLQVEGDEVARIQKVKSTASNGAQTPQS